MILLGITGAVLIILSLATGWLLTAKRYLSIGFIDRLVRDDAKLEKCHLDYIIMALVLLALYAIRVDLPLPLVVAACAGAVLNPSLFAFSALKPDADKSALSPYGIISTLTFIITTLGIGGSAVMIIYRLLG
jgi:hypothetical protein